MNHTKLFSRSAIGALLFSSLTLDHANAVIPQETVDQIRSMANPTLVLGGALDDAQGFYPEQGPNRFNDGQHVILDICKDEGPTPSIRMDFNNLDELADLRATFPGHFSQIVLDWSTNHLILWKTEHIRAFYDVLTDDGEFYLPVPRNHGDFIVLAGSEKDPGNIFLNAITEVAQFRKRFYEAASELAGTYELSVRARLFGQNWEQFIIPLEPARAFVQLNNNITLEATNIEPPGYSPFDNFQDAFSYYSNMYTNAHNRELLSSVFGDSLQVSYCSPNMNTIAEYPDLDNAFRTDEMRSEPFWLCKKKSN